MHVPDPREREVARRYFQPFIERFRGCQSIVEVAAGQGHFLELLKEAGLNGTGVELDAELCERTIELTNRKHAMCDARDALKAELPGLQQVLGEAERTFDRERTELERKRSRLGALTELSTRMEGVGKGVRSLVATGDPTLGGLVAVHDVDGLLDEAADLGAADQVLTGTELVAVPDRPGL